MILLPLHPVSLMHKNPKVYDTHPVGHTDQSIDRSEDVFEEYLVRVISVVVLVAVV